MAIKKRVQLALCAVTAGGLLAVACTNGPQPSSKTQTETTCTGTCDICPDPPPCKLTASGDGATEEEARANAFFSDDGSEILLNAEWMNVDVEVTNNGSSVHVDVTATAKPEFNPNCSEP